MMIRIRTERNKKFNWSPINRVKTDVATVTLNVTNIARARELNSFSLVASSMVFFLCSSFSFVSMRNGWPTCILAMIICSSANCGGVEEGLSVFCLFLFIVTVCLCDWNQARFSPQRTICTTSSSWFHFDWTIFKSWLWLDLNRHFHLKILHSIFISILKSLFIVFYLLNVAINR